MVSQINRLPRRRGKFARDLSWVVCNSTTGCGSWIFYRREVMFSIANFLSLVSPRAMMNLGHLMRPNIHFVLFMNTQTPH
jgi:hypothetical protein